MSLRRMCSHLWTHLEPCARIKMGWSGANCSRALLGWALIRHHESERACLHVIEMHAPVIVIIRKSVNVGLSVYETGRGLFWLASLSHKMSWIIYDTHLTFCKWQEDSHQVHLLSCLNCLHFFLHALNFLRIRIWESQNCTIWRIRSWERVKVIQLSWKCLNVELHYSV